MVKSKLVGFLLEAWDDIDRVVSGIDPKEAITQITGGSSYAWTYAHIANSTDTWINVRFQEKPPHPYIGQPHFRHGGTGVAENWQAILQGTKESRTQAARYLEDINEDELASIVIHNQTFSGDLARLSETDINMRYALLRLCAHHYYHIGEIGTKRDMRKQQVGDYPGVMERCL